MREFPVNSEQQTAAADQTGARGKRPRIFYGWYIVGAIFVMMAISSGLGFYNTAVFLAAFVDERGFSVSSVSGATAVFFITSGVSGLAIARFIDRYDPRYTMATGAVVSGIALAMMGHAREVWQVYAIYVLFGLGFSASSLLPGTTLVARWFARRRSIALSVASTGLSVGGIIFTPLSAKLIEAIGLAAAARWLGLIYVLGVVPVTALIVRPSPASIGLGMDGDAPLAPTPDGSPHVFDGTPYREAVTSWFFIALTVAYVLAMMSQVGGIAHQFKLISDRVDPTIAATGVALMASASIAGRLTGGVIVTWIAMRPFTLALMALQGVALLWLGLAQSTGPLIGASMLFGVTVGNLLMLQPLILADAFGLRDYSRIYSVSQFVTTIGVASGPALVGLLYDVLGGYAAALACMAAASVAATLSFATAGPIIQRH